MLTLETDGGPPITDNIRILRQPAAAPGVEPPKTISKNVVALTNLY